MNEPILKFENLKLSRNRVVVLFLFLFAATIPALLFSLEIMSENQTASVSLATIAIFLLYFFLFSRYVVTGYAFFYAEKIVINNQADESYVAYGLKDIKYLKITINGTYNHEGLTPVWARGPYGNTSRKAISKLHIQTVSGDNISFPMRARSMNYALAEQILEGYKAAGVEVKYVIFKNS